MPTLNRTTVRPCRRETTERSTSRVPVTKDGIAKIDRGYVLIVPETSVGDRVTVEINQARDNVGFATVVNRHLESA
jgi:predicted RNA-binding protein with TRAM domain